MEIRKGKSLTDRRGKEAKKKWQKKRGRKVFFLLSFFIFHLRRRRCMANGWMRMNNNKAWDVRRGECCFFSFRYEVWGKCGGVRNDRGKSRKKPLRGGGCCVLIHIWLFSSYSCFIFCCPPEKDENCLRIPNTQSEQRRRNEKPKSLTLSLGGADCRCRFMLRS